MSFVELTRLRVGAGQRDAFLAARPAMLRDFAADRDGFIDARLVELATGEWLDLVRWSTRADFLASREKGANRPGIAAFFDAIDAVLATEEGEEHG